MSYCKEFLKAFRKTVGAKPEEKIDKRYKPYLAPNNKYYDNEHCGYCAEVTYLSEIYHKREKDEKTMKTEKIIKESKELLTQIGRRVRENDVETEAELGWILGKIKETQYRINQECLRTKEELRTKRTIFINGQPFKLWSEFGTMWWLEKAGTDKFGFYGGMYLKEWADREYLNKVRGNEIEIKKVEIY